MGIRVPLIKVTDHADAKSAGRPDTKQISGRAVLRSGGVGAEAAPGVGTVSVGEGSQLCTQIVAGQVVVVCGQMKHLGAEL